MPEPKKKSSEHKTEKTLGIKWHLVKKKDKPLRRELKMSEFGEKY